MNLPRPLVWSLNGYSSSLVHQAELKQADVYLFLSFVSDMIFISDILPSRRVFGPGYWIKLF